MRFMSADSCMPCAGFMFLSFLMFVAAASQSFRDGHCLKEKTTCSSGSSFTARRKSVTSVFGSSAAQSKSALPQLPAQRPILFRALRGIVWVISTSFASAKRGRVHVDIFSRRYFSSRSQCRRRALRRSSKFARRIHAQAWSRGEGRAC